MKVRVKTDKKQFEMKESGPTVDQAEEENIKDKEIVAGLDEDTQFFAEDTKQVYIRFTLNRPHSKTEAWFFLNNEF